MVKVKVFDMTCMGIEPANFTGSCRTSDLPRQSITGMYLQREMQKEMTGPLCSYTASKTLQDCAFGL